MKKCVNCIILLTFALILISCGRGKVFKDRYDFDSNTWQRIDQDIQFEVEIENASIRYDIDIPIRHATFYPHAYLQIGFNVYSPSGQKSYTTRKIYLKEPDGSWKGRGMVDIWDYTYRMYDEYSFNEEGTYMIEIQNLTGHSYLLQGIMSIGVEISRSK